MSAFTAGFHAPLPPLHTGVADYAATLLASLRKRGRVEVNARQADVHLYHLGNNQLHRAIYDLAIRQPGVVVLHDALLQHFYLGAFDRERYIDEYVYNYGEWERSLAGDLWDQRAGSGMDARYFRRPMLRRVSESALAVIVHNPAAADAVCAHAPNAKVVEIPHFFDPPGGLAANAFYPRRAQLGIDENAFVFGIFGYLRESKRVMAALQCFERTHRLQPHTRLLLAGEFASSDLARAVEPYLDHPGILRLPHLAEPEFWRTAAAVDCCLNLRYPAAGETSGIGVRLMGLGKAVLFTTGREVEALPENACVRVSPGLVESAELFEYMNILAAVPWVSRQIGERAAAHVRRVHSLEAVTDQYWNTLCAARA